MPLPIEPINNSLSWNLRLTGEPVLRGIPPGPGREELLENHRECRLLLAIRDEPNPSAQKP